MLWKARHTGHNVDISHVSANDKLKREFMIGSRLSRSIITNHDVIYFGNALLKAQKYIYAAKRTYIGN